MNDDVNVKLGAAKSRLSIAAQGCLSGKPGAADEADQAKAEVASLLVLLQASRGHECSDER